MEEEFSNTLPREPESVAKLAIIMRGLPGSGKSYWVEQFIVKQPEANAVAIRENGYFSTDSYFYQGDEYCFDASRLSEYHQRNLTGFVKALANAEPIVICDNTNMAHWESMAYEAAARALDYQVRYVLMGEPSNKAHQLLCSQRNSHDIPLTQIEAMASKFEQF